MSVRLPITPFPETVVTTRVPRTRKYFLGERRGLPFQVPEQRGRETEWVCTKVDVYKPDGSKDELNEQHANLLEPEDGLFVAVVDFNMTGIWTVIFYYGPEDSSELFQYRMRVRVVA